MKKIYQLITYIFILLLISQLQLLGQVYVNSTASGNGDGSSWSNAYTTIIDAIAASNVGTEIWIAQGTYIQSERLELMDSGLKIYGSFAGTETAIDQRDFVNETIISGDVGGDDDESDLTINSDDNLDLVIFAMESAGPLILDGIVVEGGRGALVGEFSDEPATGGGLITHGKINLSNCKIRNNSARFGGGMYIKHSVAVPTDMNFENCQIINNTGVKFGGGIYAGFGGMKSRYTNCEFSGNTCEFGAGIYCAGGSVTSFADFENCTFLGNEADAGGGITSAGFCAVTLTGCTLEANEAGRGGGLSVAGANASATVDDCTFLSNLSIADVPSNGLGAAVAMEGGSTTTFTGTTFDGNVADQVGGSLSLLSDNSSATFTECTLENNASTGWGGAIYAQDDGNLAINSSLFRNNKSAGGGAIYLDNPISATIAGTTFDQNLAEFGGAIEAEDGSTILNLSNCSFTKNVADTSGGALYIWSGAEVSAVGCIFDENKSNASWAGAVWVQSFGEMVNHSFKRCIFNSNVSVEAAGALYHQNGNLDLTNCIFIENIASGDGIGNTISTNHNDGSPSSLSLINNTIYDNGVGLGSITQWSGSEASSVVNAQNNIFSGQSVHRIVEGGTAEFNSQGGNLSSGTDMDDVLTENSDLKNTDPLFVNPGFDFELQDNSPCINAGIAADAPTTDILGRPRDATPDIGALEFGGVVSSRSFEKLEGQLTMFGNPVQDILKAEWLSETNGLLQVQVTNAQGSITYHNILNKVAGSLQIEIPVARWAQGNYFITLQRGSKILSRPFSKM